MVSRKSTRLPAEEGELEKIVVRKEKKAKRKTEEKRASNRRGGTLPRDQEF